MLSSLQAAWVDRELGIVQTFSNWAAWVDHELGIVQTFSNHMHILFFNQKYV